MFKNIFTIKIITNSLAPVLSALFLSLVLLPACKQDNLRKPLENDGMPPGPVGNIKVENLPGGAKIMFSRPDDLDLLYIQADYEIREGAKEEAQASLYDNFLIVNGFPDTAEHQVALFAVDRGGNKSDPVTVRIKPLLSPVQQVYNSMTYKEDFGGINVKFKNEAQADVVVTVMIKDQASGDWVVYDKDYTSLVDGDFSVRGLPSLNTTFGVYVQDRWDNHSDTLVKELVPLYEVELDKKKFKGVTLKTDAVNKFPITQLWDNDSEKKWGFKSSAGVPVWFTMDLGVKAKLSRFKTWQIHDGREFGASNINHFQVWGSNNPDTDGSFDGWTMLIDCQVVKPSGLPEGELSNEDVEAAAAGQEFTLPADAPAVRYIRFKVLSTFTSPPGSATGDAWLAEVTFWGQVQ